MTNGPDTNTAPTPKGWRKHLQLRINRWDATISYLFSLFFIYVFVRNLLGEVDFDWITWVDAMQTGLLFYIMAVVSNLHYKLLDSKKD